MVGAGAPVIYLVGVAIHLSGRGRPSDPKQLGAFESNVYHSQQVSDIQQANGLRLVICNNRTIRHSGVKPTAGGLHIVEAADVWDQRSG